MCGFARTVILTEGTVMPEMAIVKRDNGVMSRPPFRVSPTEDRDHTTAAPLD